MCVECTPWNVKNKNVKKKTNENLKEKCVYNVPKEVRYYSEFDNRKF